VFQRVRLSRDSSTGDKIIVYACVLSHSLVNSLKISIVRRIDPENVRLSDSHEKAISLNKAVIGCHIEVKCGESRTTISSYCNVKSWMICGHRIHVLFHPQRTKIISLILNGNACIVRA